VVVLASLSGATDAVGFVALGSAFTSVMTGNMVLVGVAAGTHEASALGFVATAIAAYVTGVAIGTRVTGQPESDDGVWPPFVTRALVLEAGLLATYAVIWWSLGSDPSRAWFAPLLALNAAALGVQSSAILRFGVNGLSTTYLTGTLTSVVVRLASGQRGQTVGHPVRILAGLILGASVGAGLVQFARPATPAFQLALIVIVIGSGLRLERAGTS
jgi:uncharacterized membrane protein YoaK (UPF0700 family)